MKEPQECSACLIRQLLICAALLLAAGCATEAPVGINRVLSAKVVYQKGAAQCFTGHNVWQPLKLGDIVKPGTIIQTAAKSRIDLVLGDCSGRNIVRIWENTLLGIDKLTSTQAGADEVTETQLDLKAGHIFGMVRKMSAASKYEVKIPNGVAGLRGTVYDINAEGVVKVLSGSVVLAYVGPDGTVVTEVIVGWQQFDARTGTPTSIPYTWRNSPVSRRF